MCTLKILCSDGTALAYCSLNVWAHVGPLCCLPHEKQHPNRNLKSLNGLCLCDLRTESILLLGVRFVSQD